MTPNPWRPIKTCRRYTSMFKPVDLWLRVYASPRSFGMGDEFRVIECWREDGKWVHRHEGKTEELFADYITHWAPIPKPPRKR